VFRWLESDRRTRGGPVLLYYALRVGSGYVRKVSTEGTGPARGLHGILSKCVILLYRKLEIYVQHIGTTDSKYL
jgi:hypothetical protein